MEFGAVPMLVIIAVVSKLLDDKGSDGVRPKLRAIVPVYKVDTLRLNPSPK